MIDLGAKIRSLVERNIPRKDIVSELDAIASDPESRAKRFERAKKKGDRYRAESERALSGLKARRSPWGRAEVFEETPQASGLAAGFFFSGRRNEFAAIRIALVRKAGILPRNVSSRNNPICRSIRPSYAGPDGDWRANEIDRLLRRRTPDRRICETVFLHVLRTIDVS